MRQSSQPVQYRRKLLQLPAQYLEGIPAAGELLRRISAESGYLLQRTGGMGRSQRIIGRIRRQIQPGPLLLQPLQRP
ncbi:hypothetical protein D3C81_2288650 [compost metagenome]